MDLPVSTSVESGSSSKYLIGYYTYYDD